MQFRTYSKKQAVYSPLIFLCRILIVPNHCFIGVYLWFIFNCYARQPMLIKISDEYIIKNVDWELTSDMIGIWCSFVLNHCFKVIYHHLFLWLIFNCCAWQPTHIKISNEYIIKNVHWEPVSCSFLKCLLGIKKHKKLSLMKVFQVGKDVR